MDSLAALPSSFTVMATGQIEGADVSVLCTLCARDWVLRALAWARCC